MEVELALASLRSLASLASPENLSLMDLAPSPLPSLSHSQSPAYSPDSEGEALHALHALQQPWEGKVKLSDLLGLGGPLGPLCPLGPLGPLPVDRTMVGTRKRKGWDQDEDQDEDSCEPPSSKMSRDQLLLADCLDNIHPDPADLVAVDDSLMRDHKRDSGSLSRSSWPVSDITDHLTADLDGLGVDSYNISEAFLSLPSLTVFKQEAPSPTPNENGVAQMSPLSLATNLVDSDPNANSSQRPHQASPLHHLLQPALPAPQTSPHQDCCGSNAVTEINSLSSESAYQTNQGGQSTSMGDCRFQYVLAAATSIATKLNEETLTYLNQGQSYEIKFKKLGELSNYRGRVLKSVIRICFHDRRLQYMEREQLTSWQVSRPGERIVEVDVPLSYGAFDIVQDASQLNAVEFLWDATKEVGVYIKVNCISTEFTPKKHGGEKGVPFRIQVETMLHGDNSGKRLHAAACQVKVFKLKGADRKHKQDREKIMKRPMQEHDKFQPSYDCTVLTDISNEAVAPPMCMTVPSGGVTPVQGITVTDPGVNRGAPLNSSPISTPTLTKDEVNQNLGDVLSVGLPVGLQAGAAGAGLHPLPVPGAIDPSLNVLSNPGYCEPLMSTATDQQTSQWLQKCRFGAHVRTFSSFCGADLLRLSRDDLIQICGLADGIRLFNALHGKSLTPRLTMYLVQNQPNVNNNSTSEVFRALYLDTLTCSEMAIRLANHVGISQSQVADILFQGPGGIRVLVTDEVVQRMKNECLFNVEVCPDPSGERYCLLLKSTSK